MNRVSKKTAGKLFFKTEAVIEAALKENNLHDLIHYSKIYKYWDLIVGGPLADKTLPTKLEKKVLWVMVEDAAYAHNLRFYVPTMLDLIASDQICGEGVVKSIRFRVGPINTVRHQIKQPDLKEKKKIVVKKEEKQRSDACSSVIQDRRLKTIFSKLMSKHISRDEESNK